MSQFKSSNPFTKFGLVAVFVIALLAGCSESPLSTSVEPQSDLLTRSPEAKAIAGLASSSMYTEQVITAAGGGRIELLDVVLEIPAGAVSNDTTFSIEIPDVNVFYNEFGTSGLVFNVPVKVTMSYRDAQLDGVDESTIRIAWLNEATGEFEDVDGTVDYENKTITAELEHFSAYGLISDRLIPPSN